MDFAPFKIRQENVSDDNEIIQVHKEVFGPGRLARTAYRIREGSSHSLKLSFVAEIDAKLIASVRLTSILVGETPGLLLGPLAVSFKYKNQGIGRKLLKHSVDKSTKVGEKFILLVGEEQYYHPFGFNVVNNTSLKMPGPVDPAKLLIANLRNDENLELSGFIRGAGNRSE